MNKLAGAAIIALATAFGSNSAMAQAATCELPEQLSAALAEAGGAADVAAIVGNSSDDLIPCVLEQADALGIASPSAVVALLITPTTPPARIEQLVAFAAEAEAAGEIDVADTGGTGGVLGDGGPATGGNGTNIPSAAQNSPEAVASPN